MKIYRQLTEARTDEAKRQRRLARKQGKDFCSRRGKVLVPRPDEEANCVTAVQGKESLVMEIRKDVIPNIWDDYNSTFRKDEVSGTLTGNIGASAAKNGQKIVEITSLNPKARESERVHTPEGISPALRATKGGSSGASTLVVEQHTVAYSKSTRPTHIDVRGKVNGEANTLSTGDGGSNMSSQNFIVTHYGHKDKEYEPKDISPTLKAQSHGHEPMAVDVNTNVIKIRKLTPIECERLQGYPDDHTKFGRKLDGTIYEMSNTQRYKQIGNGISSPVTKAILEKLIPEGEVRILSTFSGIGGTELLLPERFKVVGNCEFDKYASDVLRYHWPETPNFGDVTELVNRDDVPEFDLLTGGFPCQSWSISGLRQGFDDEKGRGQLIYNIFDILRKFKPRYFLLENVKGLLSHNKGDSFEAIMEQLSLIGYEVDFELVNSKHFGLAQNRERVFIFGELKQGNI